MFKITDLCTFSFTLYSLPKCKEGRLDTKREANTGEVKNLRDENEKLKAVVAELLLKNRVLKKYDWLRVDWRKYIRFTQQEKYEIIRLVETSEIGANRTLKEIGINKSTFYNWYNRYLEDGFDGLAPKPRTRNTYWNKIPDIHPLIFFGKPGKKCICGFHVLFILWFGFL